MDDREELIALRRLAELEAKAGGTTPAATPAPTYKDPPPMSERKQPEPLGFIDKAALGADAIMGRLGSVLPDWVPGRQAVGDFAKHTVQSASSGPVMGVVQKVAQATGNKELSDKIAKNAEEGNFIGGLLQPEGWLTATKAADFINKGGNLATKALRSGATVAPYAAASVNANPSDSVLADTAKQGAVGFGFGTALPLGVAAAGGVLKPIYNIIEPYLGKAGAERAGARMVAKIAEGEGQADEIANLLLAAKQGQTAADAVLPSQNAEVIAMQRLVGQSRPSLAAASERAKDAAARAEIDKIAGTPELMQRVIERRASRTEPMRQTAMQSASTADDTISRLAPRIEQKQESMIDALRQGKGMARYDTEGNILGGTNTVHPATEAAQAGVRNAEGKSGWISNADRAQEFGAASGDFGIIKTQRQAERDFLTRQVESLKDYGLKPLDVDGISASISRRMKQPGEGIGIDAKVLEGVGSEIKRIQALKGRVYPEDLHEIRKKGINDVIESLNTGAPGSTQKRASQVASDVRTKIDEVLDEASGGMWTPYLKSFSRLSRMKDAMETGQGLKDALTGRFGNERISPFGTALRKAEDKTLPESGRTAIESLYPRQRNAVDKVVQQFENERQISELAKAGSPEALRMMRATELPGTAPGMISWKITALNKVLNALEGTGGVKTNKALAELMLNDPKKLGALMQNQGEPMIDDITKAIIQRQAAIAASR